MRQDPNAEAIDGPLRRLASDLCFNISRKRTPPQAGDPQWELREYGRKQSWTLRYEPRGTEQDAPGRTVAQYTGV